MGLHVKKKVEEASKFEIGRRLVYLKETCKHGEYLPKLEAIGISSQESSEYTNYFLRFSVKVPHWGNLSRSKIRELLRIPKGKEEEYLNKISAPEEVKEELGTTNSQVFDDLDFFTL